MENYYMGYLYTTLQFILLGLIFFTPPLIPTDYVTISVLTTSVLLGLWAIWAFRYTRINIFPYLPKEAQLIQTGPYRYVRHPMYTAVLLFAFSYVIQEPGWLYFLYFLALLIVIVLKIRFEEHQLESRFNDYQAIFFKTYRIIPCIY
jgi:protein-S-isoprenylcysteine O-methyltransferase Ste14